MYDSVIFLKDFFIFFRSDMQNTPKNHQIRLKISIKNDVKPYKNINTKAIKHNKNAPASAQWQIPGAFLSFVVNDNYEALAPLTISMISLVMEA